MTFEREGLTINIINKSVRACRREELRGKTEQRHRAGEWAAFKIR